MKSGRFGSVERLRKVGEEMRAESERSSDEVVVGQRKAEEGDFVWLIELVVAEHSALGTVRRSRSGRPARSR